MSREAAKAGGGRATGQRPPARRLSLPAVALFLELMRGAGFGVCVGGEPGKRLLMVSVHDRKMFNEYIERTLEANRDLFIGLVETEQLFLAAIEKHRAKPLDSAGGPL